jgi:N-acylmannosamine kinase
VSTVLHYGIALDIGGTNSRIALFEDGRIVWRKQLPTPGSQGPQAMLQTMGDLRAGLDGFKLPPCIPTGVAIAAQVANGCVNTDNQSILRGWQHVPLRALLAQQWACPLLLVNDARAAAWGEYEAGAGQGCEQFLFVTVSTGVGAGLVLNRRLHLAANGFDGELGETLLDDGSTLESHTSGSAVHRLALQHGHASGKALCDAADQGDAAADRLLQAAILPLAKKLADLVVLLGLEKIAIGGGLGLRPSYLARLRQAMARFAPMYQCPLVAAQLGDDAGLQGVQALLPGLCPPAA